MSTAIISKLNEEYLEPFLRVSFSDFNWGDDAALTAQKAEQLLAFSEKHTMAYSEVLEGYKGLRGEIVDFNVSRFMFNQIKMHEFPTKMIKEVLKKSVGDISAKAASTFLTHSDSYNRMYFLVKLRKRVQRDDWFKLFFEFWSQCDACSMYANEIKAAFKGVDMAEMRNKYYSEEQWAAHQALPDEIEVWRGCHLPTGRNGISWSLDEQVGRHFSKIATSLSARQEAYLRPMLAMQPSQLDRYEKMISGTPALCKTVLKKDDGFILLGRQESEVICMSVDKKMVEVVQGG